MVYYNSGQRGIIARFFFPFVLLELFLCGSGQEIHITSFLTLRMVNFVIAFVLSLCYFLSGKKVPKCIISFLLIYTILLIWAVFIGLLHDSNLGLIIEDVKPLLYLYIILFFYFVIDSELLIKKTYNIILFCSKILIILYLLYILLTDITGILDFSWAYSTFNTNSFLFRGIGSAFFYKSFVYIPIASVGFLMDKKYIWFSLSIFAIFFTYTRGLYLLSLVGILLYFIKIKGINFNVIAGLLVVSLIVLGIAMSFDLFSYSDDYIESKDSGDETRIQTINQVKDKATLSSFMVGHGFGQGVKERTIHMEMSYLEILHKQGILGLFFWLLFLIGILRNGNIIKKSKLSSFFIIAALLIYVQSLFNPYINNPMGIGMISLSFIICYRLAHENTMRNCSI